MITLSGNDQAAQTTPTSSAPAPAPSTTPPTAPPTSSTSSPSASTTTTAAGCSPLAGEAKWGETIGLPHLDLLRHIRDLLTGQGRPGAAHASLARYSGNGITDDLRQAAGQDDSIVMITVDDLYGLRTPLNHP